MKLGIDSSEPSAHGTTKGPYPHADFQFFLFGLISSVYTRSSDGSILHNIIIVDRLYLVISSQRTIFIKSYIMTKSKYKHVNTIKQTQT